MAMRKPTSIAYQAASEIDLSMLRWQGAIDKAMEAIDLDPNDASGQLILSRVLVFSGRLEEAEEYVKKAMRLDPHNPARPLAILGLIYLCKGQYEEAVTLIERSSRHNPDLTKGLYSLNVPNLAAAYAYIGRDNDAQATLGRYWGILSLPRIMKHYPFMYSKDAARLAEGLIKANASPPHEYYKTFIENRLNGKEIRALIFGRKAVGSDGTINRSKDGEATYRRFPSITDRGKSWIEDDMLCDQWLKHLGGMKICYPVFRNPDTSNAMKTEYLYHRDHKTVPFLLVD
jgi:tetratricopeptide (TPR) repeat protein